MKEFKEGRNVPSGKQGGIFECIDAHTCGNPVRLVKEGGPVLYGKNMSEKRQYFLKEYDWIRTGLMFEPRGHDMMSGCILYPPHDPQNDLAVLFIETSGCLPMCGHGTIGTVTIVIEEEIIKPKTEGIVRLETPAGLVVAEYKPLQNPPREEGQPPLNPLPSGGEPILNPSRGEGLFEDPVNLKVKSVKFTNVQSFLAAEGLKVNCSDLGELVIDVSYGGNFYAIVDVQENFPGLQEFNSRQLVTWARELRKNINEKYSFVHPEDETIKGCTHIMWTGAAKDKNATGGNAVFYGDNGIDRSPCGTGTSARMAQWYTKGKLKKGDEFIHESIIGSKFIGRIEEETTVHGMPAIRPSIEGWAKIYGYNRIIIDPDDDPYAYGFQVV